MSKVVNSDCKEFSTLVSQCINSVFSKNVLVKILSVHTPMTYLNATRFLKQRFEVNSEMNS